MPRGYRHLTYAQRCHIFALLHRGECKSRIATIINVHPSTVYRELARNSSPHGYTYDFAQQEAATRRHTASSSPTTMTPAMVRMISFLLQDQQWSPEQISGWLRLNSSQSVSHESIYRLVWKDKRQGGSLYRHLRHSGKKYNKRKGKTAGRGLIPNRVDIALRPKIVEQKARLGDWEVDTIIGKKHKGALLSCVDRASKLVILVKLPNKTANAVVHACHQIKAAGWPVRTLTFDNGKEFSKHETIATILKADTFFATPYHSWERGLNEHTNGLVRQYFPKKYDLSKVTHQAVQMVENRLNLRPRKVLGFRSPLEFAETMTKHSCVALHC